MYNFQLLEKVMVEINDHRLIHYTDHNSNFDDFLKKRKKVIFCSYTDTNQDTKIMLCSYYFPRSSHKVRFFRNKTTRNMLCDSTFTKASLRKYR